MRYLSLPGTSGHWASTPDVAALDITGDIGLRAKVAPNLWSGSPGVETLVSKWNGTGNQRSYMFNLLSTGALQLLWSPDGTAGAQITANSTATTGFTNGTVHWVRVSLDVNNGAGTWAVDFYTSENGTTWTQLGITITAGATTSIFAGTARLGVGAINGGNGQRFTGKAYEGQVLNGIAGTLVADFNACDFELGDSDTDTAVDSTGKTWTINGAGSEIEDDGSGFCPGEEPILSGRAIRSPRYGVTRVARR